MSPKEWLAALVAIADHPLAIGIYALLVVSWLILSLRVNRHRSLLRQIEKIPEPDRIKALELEMGPIPREGIDAEQWLRARAQVFNLARWVALGLTVVVLSSFAVYLNAAPKQLTVNGRVLFKGGALPDERPATVVLAGVKDQEWPTDRAGNFAFTVTDVIAGDSLRLTAIHRGAVEVVQAGVAVAKANATGVTIDLVPRATRFMAGHVVEERTGRPIQGATVTIVGDRGAGSTNAVGSFRFVARGDSLQEIELVVTHPQYRTFRGGMVLAEQGNRIVMSRRR
jgi:hypothetical protein